MTEYAWPCPWTLGRDFIERAAAAANHPKPALSDSRVERAPVYQQPKVDLPKDKKWNMGALEVLGAATLLITGRVCYVAAWRQGQRQRQKNAEAQSPSGSISKLEQQTNATKALQAALDAAIVQRDRHAAAANAARAELAAAMAKVDALEKRAAADAVRASDLERQLQQAEQRGPGPEALKLSNIREGIRRHLAASTSLQDLHTRARAMLLQWHPDKHQVLPGLATEVTKVINSTRECLEQAMTARAS